MGIVWRALAHLQALAAVCAQLAADPTAALGTPLGVTSGARRPPPSGPLSLEEALALLARDGDSPGRRLDGSVDPVEQVHVSFNAAGEAVVTFATRQRGLASSVRFGLEGGPLDQVAEGQVSTYTQLICPTNHYLTSPPLGTPPITDKDLATLLNTSSFLPPSSASYKYLANDAQAWRALKVGCFPDGNPKGYYQSPYLHTAVLRGLQPRTRYTYQPSASTRSFTFQMPPLAGQHDPQRPFKLGVWADVGTSNISYAVMRALASWHPEVAILVGDLSYADGWGPTWDLFGIMHEPFMASVGHLTVTGNHELSEGRHQGIDWMYRYPVPYRAAGSETPLFWSYEMGLMHIIGIAGSYAPTDQGSSQYAFVEADLARVNRTLTPWVVVEYHTPWYNSNDEHYQEGWKHQEDMEALFYEHGVDIIFNGHVHDYERSFPVHKGELDPCGPVHIIIGDAGNYEGPGLPYREPQPVWSAFREASFGAGLLTVVNSTHAEWEWQRVACVFDTGMKNEFDEVVFGWDNVSGPPGTTPCNTSGDTTAQRFLPIDRAVFIRDEVACPSRASGGGPGLPRAAALQSASPTPRRLEPAEAPSSSSSSASRRGPPPIKRAPPRPAAALGRTSSRTQGRAATAVVPGVTSSFRRPPPASTLHRAEIARRLGREDVTSRRLEADEGAADEVEQVHLGLAGPSEVVVTYLARSRDVPSKVVYGLASGNLTEEATGEVSSYVSYICLTNKRLRTPNMGNPIPVPPKELTRLVNTSAFLPNTSLSYCYIATDEEAWLKLHDTCLHYKNPLAYHQSPYIHTVVLSQLQPGAKYSYRPGGSNRTFTFTALPAAGQFTEGVPFRIGVWADVGITDVSMATMRVLQNLQPDLVLLVGDLSYSDGWAPIWDDFGMLTEPLMASVATLSVAGNHEMYGGSGQALDWMQRYPVPFRASGSESAHYYSYDAGLVHIIGLVGNYAPTRPGSPQYAWLEEDLQRVNRTKTPWLVVQFHCPMYTSSVHDIQEALQAQRDLEDMFYQYGVDVVFNGHVHSYERSVPMYKGQPDPCGAMHIVIGDGGNFQGPAVDWSATQPEWSAFREASFGAGVLSIHDSTHAEWQWNRSLCVKTTTETEGEYYTPDSSPDCGTDGDISVQRLLPVDKAAIVRNLQCANRGGQGLEDDPHSDFPWWGYLLCAAGAATLAGGVFYGARAMGRHAAAREGKVAESTACGGTSEDSGEDQE